MSAKITPVFEGPAGDKRIYGYGWECPGCGCLHIAHIVRNVTWNFNGDVEKPTFTPSLKVTQPIHGQPDGICHFFITDGVAQFCGDCTHDKRGQNIPLADIDFRFDEDGGFIGDNGREMPMP